MELSKHRVHFLLFTSMVIMVFYSGILLGQSITQKKELSKEKLVEYNKELFYPNVDFEYYISKQTLQTNFDNIKDNKYTNEKYIDSLKKEHSKEPNHPIINNELGYYYTVNNDAQKSSYHYKIAYDNLDVEYLDGDSAQYYFMKGYLSFHLGKDRTHEYFNKSLEIDPKALLANTFYSIILIQEGDFSKLNDLSIEGLEQGINIENSYVSLILSTFYKKILELNNGGDNEEDNHEFSKEEYIDIFDFELIEKYAVKYKDSITIQNGLQMSHLFGLTLKLALTFQETGELFDDEIDFYSNFSRKEKKKIKNLEKWSVQSLKNNTLNEYSVYYNLGLIHFIKNEWDASIENYKKAIEVFPKSKKGMFFSDEKPEKGVYSSYFLKRAYKPLLTEIKKKYEGVSIKDIPRNDLILMGLLMFNIDDQDFDEHLSFAEKMYEVHPKDPEVLRIIAHLKMLKGNIYIGELYGSEALNLTNDILTAKRVFLQFAVYLLHNGKIEGAYNNIQTALELTEKNNVDCELCHELLDEYILIEE